MELKYFRHGADITLIGMNGDLLYYNYEKLQKVCLRYEGWESYIATFETEEELSSNAVSMIEEDDYSLEEGNIRGYYHCWGCQHLIPENNMTDIGDLCFPCSQGIEEEVI